MDQRNDLQREEKPLRLRTRKRWRHPGWQRSIVLLAAAAVLILGMVGGTVAYLVAGPASITNRFTYSHVSCEVQEDFEDNVKTDVKIENTGDTEAYIRAEIVVTWQDEDGNVYGKAPTMGTDYTLTLNLTPDSGWTKGSDGYYYYASPVAPVGAENNNVTEVLINICEPVTPSTAPEGFHLAVEIMADAVQSTPADAVKEAWGVTVSDIDRTISKSDASSGN